MKRLVKPDFLGICELVDSNIALRLRFQYKKKITYYLKKMSQKYMNCVFEQFISKRCLPSSSTNRAVVSVLPQRMMWSLRNPPV